MDKPVTHDVYPTRLEYKTFVGENGLVQNQFDNLIASNEDAVKVTVTIDSSVYRRDAIVESLSRIWVQVLKNFGDQELNEFVQELKKLVAE